jgi:hypothetical protein
MCFDPIKSNSETELWVEKFKPKSFLELLSDDVKILYLKILKDFKPIKN